MGWRLEGLRFKYRQVQEIFLFSKTSRPAQPQIQSVPGVPSQEIKQPGRENGQSTPSSAELRTSVAIPLLTLCVFTACEGTTLIFLLTKIISRHKLLVSITIYLKVQVVCDVMPFRLVNNFRSFEGWL